MADEINLQKEFDEIVSGITAKVSEMRTANEKANNELALKMSEQVSKLEKMQNEIKDELINARRGNGNELAAKKSETPYRDSLDGFVRSRSAKDWDSSQVRVKAGNTGTVTGGTDGEYGGVLVPSELDNQILKSVIDNTVLYANVARRVVSTPEFSMPVHVSGVATEWLTSETATITQQDAPTFKLISPEWGNLATRADLSIQLIEDSKFDVVTYLMNEFGEAFADELEKTLTEGRGSDTDKPVGLLDATLAVTKDKTRAVGTYQKINTGGDFTADSLIKLFCAAKPAYRQNGAFMMNSNTELEIRLLKDGDERYIWQPSISVDRPATILNRPLLINEYMQDAGTADNIPVIFGDFKRGFMVVERTGMHIKQDDITGDLVVKYKCFKRYGSMFTDSCALKYLVKTAS